MSEPTTPPEGEVEIARICLVGDELECSLRAGVFEDAALWGHVLADLARNVAQVVEQEDGTDAAETMRRICEAFAAELDAPPGGDS